MSESAAWPWDHLPKEAINRYFQVYKMPSTAGLSPEIKDNSDGSITVQYHPTKGGRHEVQMAYDGAAVDGSPFSCFVDQINGAFITAFGTGLVGGMSGQMESFTVTAKQGTLGQLSVNVDGPTKTDVKRQDHGDKCDIQYLPMTPGVYNISVKYAGKEIKGSPFIAKVSGEGRKRSQISLGNTSECSLNILETNVVDLVGTIKTPAGAIEPCLLKKDKDGHLCVASFTPREIGTYNVNIYRDEKAIKGSPFHINIGDKEIAHASKVKVTGATQGAKANVSNHLDIDCTEAGIGGLSVVVEGPHRSEIECESAADKKYKINFSPHEPGIYILSVRYADDHVSGSPFLLEVGGEPSGRVRETVNKNMEQAEPVKKGTDCEFFLKIPGTNPFDMEASTTDPDGATELCEILDEEDFHYRIKFTPQMEGVHTLSIKHKGLHISGSPFIYSVGQLAAGGTHKVQVGGPGIEKGEVGLSNDFNIYTREAGAGELSVAVEGPSDARIRLEERPHGFLGVSYTVSKPGIYGVHVKWNGEHIPGSPYRVHISPDSGVARQVTVHSLKDRGLQVDKANTFTVSYNGARGQLSACIRTPSGSHEDCFVQEMDDGLYGVRFIPKENGVHYLDIKLSDHHIPDSPFAIMVGSTAADPAMVHAHGDGLDNGKCGQKNKFTVRTAGAGSGFLAVFLEGPSKCALSCREVDEGYEFSYTPFAAGKYLITIKYGNINIAGSPYAPEVTGSGRKPSPLNEQTSMVVETVDKKPGAKSLRRFKGDASKVTVRGPGLKKARMNSQQSFTIDVKDAGHAMLYVGMVAPNGYPEPELMVKKNKVTEYTVTYKVAEVGEHTLVVKWGDEEIPGSPFSLCT